MDLEVKHHAEHPPEALLWDWSGPGWYFHDRREMFGPYASEEECREGAEMYSEAQG